MESHWVLKKIQSSLSISCLMIKCKYKKKIWIWGPEVFYGQKFMGTIRSTIVINKGKILKIWSNVRVKDHAKEVLNFIKSSK